MLSSQVELTQRSHYLSVFQRRKRQSPIYYSAISLLVQLATTFTTFFLQMNSCQIWSRIMLIKLQHRLTENHHKSKVQEFMDHLSTSRDRSRFQSLQGQGAGAWISAVPSISVLALSSKEFNLATLIRLGCKIPQSTRRCDCGRDLDQEGYHLVTRKLEGVLFKQQCYCACLVKVFSQTELPAQQRTDSSIPQQRQQTRHCCYRSPNWPQHRTRHFSSASLVHCLLALAVSTAGIVASRREERKEVKYNQELLPGGIKPSFVPLVLEHFGRRVTSLQLSEQAARVV